MLGDELSAELFGGLQRVFTLGEVIEVNVQVVRACVRVCVCACCVCVCVRVCVW